MPEYLSRAENARRFAVVKAWRELDKATRGPWPGIGDWMPIPTDAQVRHVFESDDGVKLNYSAGQWRELRIAREVAGAVGEVVYGSSGRSDGMDSTQARLGASDEEEMF